MRECQGFVACMLILLTAGLACGDKPTQHDSSQLKAAYDVFAATLNTIRIGRDYSKAVQLLDSEDSAKVITGIRTLAATGEADVIPWIVPLLDSSDAQIRVWAGSSLARVVSGHELRRRDNIEPGKIVIKPRGPDDHDLRPLAWVVLKMLQWPDLHSSAATIIGYLKLEDFESDLNQLLHSRHPAVTTAAKSALAILTGNVNADFTEQQIAQATATGEAFGELFRRDDDDALGLLLLPKHAVDKVLNPKLLDGKDADVMYAKMVQANMSRFREFRSMFTDLSKANQITFQPGRLAESEFYANDVTVMKNSFARLAYANRVEVKIKIEEMVFFDGKCFIVEID